MHNDNNSQQFWQNYTKCFCSKLTLIPIKCHTQQSTKLRKPPFRFTWIIIYIYMFFVCKCIVLTDTISFIPDFHFHLLILILSFLFILSKRHLVDFFSNCYKNKNYLPLAKSQCILCLMSVPNTSVQFYFFQITCYTEINNTNLFICLISEGKFILEIHVASVTSIWCSSREEYFVWRGIQCPFVTFFKLFVCLF